MNFIHIWNAICPLGYCLGQNLGNGTYGLEYWEIASWASTYLGSYPFTQNTGLYIKSIKFGSCQGVRETTFTIVEFMAFLAY